MTLTPAYGRDYKSKAEVLADFNANKDFVIADIFHPNSGAYANKADLQGNERTINIRYKRLTQIVVIKL